MDIFLGLAGVAGLGALLQSKPVPTEKEAQTAQTILNSKRDDPAANLTLGKYKVFVEGDFPVGLSYLAKGSDKTLQVLAEHDLDPQNSDTPEKKVILGDEWVVAAKKYPAISRVFYDRASDWYSQAWPKLNDAWKDKVRLQGAKLAASRPPGPARKAFPTGWVQGTGSFIDGTVAHSGSYSAKLPEMDPKKPVPEFIFQSDPIPVAGKKLMEVTAYAMSDLTEGPADGVFVYIFDTNGAGVGTWFGLMPLDMPFWRKYSIKKEIPENIVFIKVGGTKRSKNGVIWFDDFSVKLDGIEMVKNSSFEQK